MFSAERGVRPKWRADRKELYWIGADGTRMAAKVELQAAGVRPGRAEALFRLPNPQRRSPGSAGVAVAV